MYICNVDLNQRSNHFFSYCADEKPLIHFFFEVRRPNNIYKRQMTIKL